jgi:hypothetical protein
MSVIENSRIYYVNGGARLSGSSASFTYKFSIPQNEQYDRCVVLQASIPLSYYLIQAGFNSFTLKEGASTGTITIPAGNYSAVSLITVLTTILNTSSPNGYIYTITMPNQYTSASTGRFTFSVTGNGATQPQFVFTTNLTELFGFDQNSTNNFVSNSLTTNVLNMIPENTVFIHSDIVVGDGSDILQEIYSNNTINYSMVTWVCPDVDAYSKKLSTNATNIFKFTLTNEFGQILNLNNQNMLLTIMMYKKNNIDSIFKKFLEYSLSRA